MAQELSGKVIAVTGGASGIGLACAQVLARRGASILIVDLAVDAAASAAERLPKGARHEGWALDVVDHPATVETVARAYREFGRIDGLVASAGVIQKPLSPADLPIADWDRVVDVDLRGTYYSCAAFGSEMARQGGGSIVTIASVCAWRSVPLHAYGPAKAAVVNLSQSLATEWGRSGVRVNSVSPGYTITPALEDAVRNGRDVSVLKDNAALGRLVEAEEVATAVAFLLSDDASAVTGIDLPVDAGWLAGSSWLPYGGVRPPVATA